MLMIFQVLFEFKFKQPVISDFLTGDHVKYIVWQDMLCQNAS
jgi:hypothetical protein